MCTYSQLLWNQNHRIGFQHHQKVAPFIKVTETRNWDEEKECCALAFTEAVAMIEQGDKMIAEYFVYDNNI